MSVEPPLVRPIIQDAWAFNNCIQMFPSSMVSAVINKKQAITPFSDKEAAASFDYKPNF
ncbi:MULTISPECIES: hypothetical protein [unclassified Pseudomonas]|uniref:hypothetical protein n=1 Tax=unclassified Pseudomonas TaxID=196821 RepID=UPI002113C645|nr:MULTISPECIES: hypothetical protein [unclassified Pseudomonas]